MPSLIILSDTHNQHSKISMPRNMDIIIHAGDSCINGTMDEYNSFLEWFKLQSCTNKIMINGNHDDIASEHQSDAQIYNGINHLWDREIIINNLRIYGSPYRTVPQERMLAKKVNWSAFMITETWAELVWREIPNGLDILITHQPPYGILDYSNGNYWGSTSLLEAVKRARPRYHIFGHSHDATGIYKEDTGPLAGITFINAAMCDDVGVLCKPPTMINI